MTQHTTSAGERAIRIQSLERVESSDATSYSHSISSLRAFITFLVVVEHSALAYSATTPRQRYATLLEGMNVWSYAPSVDPQSTVLAVALMAFTEPFFMSMMFLLSGLFVHGSLVRKGAARFLRDRGIRLGVPFLFIIGVMSPLCYAVSYLHTTADAHSVAGFWQQWRALRLWPAGHGWFLWLLLVFDVAAAALYRLVPMQRALAAMEWLGQRPVWCFLLLTGGTGFFLLSLLLFIDPFTWSTWGPFSIQTSRTLMYAWMFGVGALAGAARADKTVLASDGPLATYWRWWLGLAAVSYLLVILVLPTTLAYSAWSWKWRLLGGSVGSVACASYIMVLLAAFLRARPARRPFFDWLIANAFGIYVVHYAVLAWIGYYLATVSAPPALKLGITIAAVTLLSGALTSLARRSAIIRAVF